VNDLNGGWFSANYYCFFNFLKLLLEGIKITIFTNSLLKIYLVLCFYTILNLIIKAFCTYVKLLKNELSLLR